MAKTSESSDKGIDSFNLKHRVTGAGVLIFFGALVLPWLLGPPSEAKKDIASESEATITQAHSTFEDRVLQDLQGVDSDFEEPEESVYVSKITPLNASGGEASASKPVLVSGSSGTDAAQSDSETPVSAASDSTASDSTASDSTASVTTVLAASASEASENQATEGSSNEPSSGSNSSGSNSSGSNSSGSSSPSSDGSDSSGSDSLPDSTASSSSSSPEPASSNTSSSNSTKKPEPNKPKIDVGWVVQVELLTDKKGASRLVDELSNKGFDPHTTIVDTNRGSKTGTRIWLGPFAQRAQAGAENDKLEAKMGKRGFIRVYP